MSAGSGRRRCFLPTIPASIVVLVANLSIDDKRDHERVERRGKVRPARCQRQPKLDRTHPDAETPSVYVTPVMLPDWSVRVAFWLPCVRPVATATSFEEECSG